MEWGFVARDGSVRGGRRNGCVTVGKRIDLILAGLGSGWEGVKGV